MEWFKVKTATFSQNVCDVIHQLPAQNHLCGNVHVRWWLDILPAHYTGLLQMIVRVLTTCHTQYTSDSSICIFLFNRTTIQVFVTYLTAALYVHPLWFYKHQHYNRVRCRLFVACQRWWFQWRFAAKLVTCAPSGEMHNYCTLHVIKKNFENFLIHRCSLHTAIWSVLCMTSC
jgi:hypothetical protein